MHIFVFVLLLCLPLCAGVFFFYGVFFYVFSHQSLILLIIFQYKR